MKIFYEPRSKSLFSLRKGAFPTLFQFGIENCLMVCAHSTAALKASYSNSPKDHFFRLKMDKTVISLFERIRNSHTYALL